ncbi:uncharacterized protein LOC130748648 [Lotus japonicus]|uniref:uncharacterized protein LOC130748648 n=1 Tax=Lotus japonicus TaxID=34305 RepID=UPI00258FD86E|nr:uncharacterized protein LOC130748648 [Lotus japonicus]
MASQGCPHSHGLSHRHHHQHHCSHCPLRRHCHHCPLHNPPTLFQPPPLFPSLPQIPHLSPLKQPIASDAQISQELENIELDGEEEDDEPVFVLTDEWREFFAKSEAKRKIEKKQGKKGKQKK